MRLSHNLKFNTFKKSQATRCTVEIPFRLAMGKEEVTFSERVKLKTFSEDGRWTARVVRAVVAPDLAYPVILGGPFLKSNKILIDHKRDEVSAKDGDFTLVPGPQEGSRPEEVVGSPSGVGARREDLLQELQERTVVRRRDVDKSSTGLKHFAKILDDRIRALAVWDGLMRYEQELRTEFEDRFPADIPHVTKLPDDVFHRFRFKDPERVIKCRSYACLKKYKGAWRLGGLGNCPANSGQGGSHGAPQVGE